MRGLFPGYYSPSSDDLDRFWRDGTIALDANVLLSLYRFSEAAREQLLTILERLQDQLWVPHRAAFEFQRGRVGVIDEQRNQYDRALAEIEKSKKTILALVRRRSVMDHAALGGKVNVQLQPLIDDLNTLKADHPDPVQGHDLLGADAVRDRLDRILADRVGEESQLVRALKDGPRRYDASVPPGYEDRKKPAPDSFGDLMLWLEIIEWSRTSQKPVMLVTADQKQDWWLLHNGRTLSCRPELVQEIKNETGVDFYLYGLEAFITAASDRLGIETSAATLEEVKDVGTRTWIKEPIWNIGPTIGYGPGSTMLSAFSPNVAYDSGPLTNVFTIGHPRPSTASATIFPDQAMLTFSPGSEEITDNRVRCEVLTPEGLECMNTRGTVTDAGVSIRFPQDFLPEFEVEPGEYLALWLEAPLDENAPARELARNRFVIAQRVS